MAPRIGQLLVYNNPITNDNDVSVTVHMVSYYLVAVRQCDLTFKYQYVCMYLYLITNCFV